VNLKIFRYQSVDACARFFKTAPPSGQLTIEEAFILALQNYVPEPYPGTAVLVGTRDSNSYDPENANAWRRLVKQFEEVEVPGDHDSMFDYPNVPVLAKTIARFLERGETAAEG
jgi:thioesterase domain-containing protein